MKIAILSTQRKTYSTRRLKEAAIKRGHSCRVLHTLDFTVFVDGAEPGLLYRGKRVSKPDAVIPRIGPTTTTFGLAVLRQFELQAVSSLNSSIAIAKARDKFRTLQILSTRGITIPTSAIVYRESDILPTIQQLGGAPLVIKLLQGTQGVGVMLAETDQSAQAILETLKIAQKEVLIQRFVSESRGKDIRAFVIGDRVVAAMRRKAIGGEFRSNVHRGGSVEAVRLSAEFQKIAVRAAHIIGLRIAGVDILESNDGPKVMEVNSSPGLEGIEEATGIDVADAVIDYLEEQATFPELDVRERLPLSQGFGVVEFTLTKDSTLVSKSLEGSGLREMEVQVLNVTRGALAIPNPAPNFGLLNGDVILCFGRLTTLKSLMPPKKKSRTKKKTT